MNYLSHLGVAHELNPDHSELLKLAAMLDDLIKMSGSKPNVPAMNGDLAFGTWLHGTTDEVFHNLPLFRQLKAGFLEEFEDSLSRGPARGAAEAGTEILLDAVALDNEEIVAAYLDVTAWTRGNLDKLGNVALSGAKFTSFLAAYFGQGLPTYYRDPERVARVLHRRFSQYPHLEFSAKGIPAMTEALAIQQTRVRRHGYVLLKDTVEGVRQRV